MVPDLSGTAAEVAPRLLGCRLRNNTPEGTVVVELTEVEAYQGELDPASHAYRGRTPRNEIMFGPAGRLYTYLSYGVHVAANVVTGRDGEASAVLLRAGRVVEGEGLARTRRGEGVVAARLARGPGCLCRALGITLADYGSDLLSGGSLSLEPGVPVPPTRVGSGPRVGVSQAHEVPWRFWTAGEPSVSAYRRSPRAGSPRAGSARSGSAGGK